MASTDAPLSRIHESAALGFTRATISVYDTGRPDWTATQVAILLSQMNAEWHVDERGKYPALPLVELGAGTGKFTRPLYAYLKEPCNDAALPNLIAVEPTSMAEALTELVNDGVNVLRTTADDLGAISAGTVAGVVIAQAFHWFANEQSLREMHRILVPGGTVGFCWNTRDRSGSSAQAQLEDLLDSYYDESTPRQQTLAWQIPVKAFPGFTELISRRVGREPHLVTEEMLITYALSLSVIAKLPADKKLEVSDRVREIFRAPGVPFTVNSAGEKVYSLVMYTDYYWCHKV